MPPARLQSLDMDDLEAMLDEDLTIVPTPTSGSSRSSRGGESFSAPVSRVARLSGGGSGRKDGEGEVLLSPSASTPMPVVFIPNHMTASTCRGKFIDTSRFCLKTIIPGLHHCGTKSHKNKKQPVQPDTYWAPGGYVKGELVASCEVSVAASAIPETMRHLFAPTERRTASEWRSLIIDILHRPPSVSTVRSLREDEMEDSDDEDLGVSPRGVGNEEEQDDDRGGTVRSQGEFKWIGPLKLSRYHFDSQPSMQFSRVPDADIARAFTEHSAVLDWLADTAHALKRNLPPIIYKVESELTPALNDTMKEIRHIKETMGDNEEVSGVVLRRVADVEDRVLALETSTARMELDIAENSQDIINLTEARSVSEARLVGLIRKSIERSDSKIRALEQQAASGPSTFFTAPRAESDEESEDQVGSLLRAGHWKGRQSTQRVEEEVVVDIGGEEVALTLAGLYQMQRETASKVDLQLERSKTQGVAFYKVAFPSQSEFKAWYLQGNPTGKALSAFVDLISIWAFAAHSRDTPMEFLQRAAKSKVVDLMSGVDIDYAHSMTIRYPGAFESPKNEEMTAHHRFGIFNTLAEWKGTGALDGKKERLLETLRLAVDRHRSYCDDNLAPGPVKDHALRSASFTQSFFEALLTHLEGEISLFSTLKLADKKIFTLLSNELMQVCDELFEVRQLGINVDYANKLEVGMKFAWVTFHALGKMMEYMKVKFKNHPAISSIFVRFLTQQTGDTSAAGLKTQVADLEKEVKKLKEALATKESVSALHNKLELIISRNNLKKT